MTATWTEADRDAIKAKIAAARIVRYGDRMVENYDLPTLLKLLLVIDAALAVDSGASINRVAGYSKGLSSGRSDWQSGHG